MPMKVLMRMLAAGLLGLWAGLTSLAPAVELRALTESLPPFNYQEEGRITGYATELLREMLAEAGHSARFELMPWPRAYQQALSLPDVVLYSTVRNAEREKLFQWIGPIAERRMYVYKLRERQDIQVKTLADIVPYRIGLVRGMASSQLLLNAMENQKLRADFTHLQELNFRKLIAGRLDLVVAMDYGMSSMAKAQRIDPAAIEPVLLLDQLHPLYFALSRDTDPAVVRKLSAAFERLKASGRMDRLKAIYLH
ncbi:MAG: transporter substrate-binding domain-containing protein [Gammaproteobacteria bacterium]|nr:transporter substrate-binding domain-containing protein [Gammaproteobacteria bacterium]